MSSAQASATGAGVFEVSILACDAGPWEAALAEGGAPLVHGHPQEVVVRDARDLHRVLERQEDALLRALLRRPLRELLAALYAEHERQKA